MRIASNQEPDYPGDTLRTGMTFHGREGGTKEISIIQLPVNVKVCSAGRKRSMLERNREGPEFTRAAAVSACAAPSGFQTARISFFTMKDTNKDPKSETVAHTCAVTCGINLQSPVS